ncbi:DUF4860 domain-containing protein [Oscillospiraceae bacterium 50-16]|nr:DUF4860 domain-containing protein [Lawsonibacter sp.]
MKRTRIHYHLDGLIALLLFGVFAVCVLAVLLTGASAYQRLTQRDMAAYDSRVCIQYIAARVRQADRDNGVSVEPFGGRDALILTEEGGYATYVYWHEGYLMELYTSVDGDLAPEDGEKLMASGGLELSLEDGLLTVDITQGTGEQDTLCLSLRSGEGAV